MKQLLLVFILIFLVGLLVTQAFVASSKPVSGAPPYDSSNSDNVSFFE